MSITNATTAVVKSTSARTAAGARCLRLLRVASGDAFKLLRALSLTIWMPAALLGLVGSVLIVGDATVRRSFDAELLFALIAPAGLAGLAGLIRGHAHGTRTSTGGIELTQYLIVIGIAAAASLLALSMVAAYQSAAIRYDDFGWGEALVLVPLLGLVVLIIDGLVQIQRANTLLVSRACPDNTVSLSLLCMALTALAAVMFGLNV
jgi:hypothetical protein